jgi:serine/threonine protein kinase
VYGFNHSTHVIESSGALSSVIFRQHQNHITGAATNNPNRILRLLTHPFSTRLIPRRITRPGIPFMRQVSIEAISEVLDSKGYSLVKEIGRGSSAICYLVFSRLYQTPFVAKVMTGLTESSLQCETSALRGLSHPNVIYLYDIHPTPEAIYLILEYCPGGSLTTHVAKNGVMAGRPLYGMAKQVLTGLCYIHSMRWAHLDLKPANILIDKHGRVKLADFGISHMFEESGEATRRGGTVEFAAPELFQLGAYDPFKVDVWALAVTVYFMAFAAFPFPTRVVGGEVPTYAFSTIPFPTDADPLIISTLKAMFVIDPVKRPTAADCLNFPLFMHGDVKDGWLEPTSSGDLPSADLTAVQSTGYRLSKTLSQRKLYMLRPFTRSMKSMTLASGKRVPTMDDSEDLII